MKSKLAKIGYVAIGFTLALCLTSSIGCSGGYSRSEVDGIRSEYESKIEDLENEIIGLKSLCNGYNAMISYYKAESFLLDDMLCQIKGDNWAERIVRSYDCGGYCTIVPGEDLGDCNHNHSLYDIMENFAIDSRDCTDNIFEDADCDWSVWDAGIDYEWLEDNKPNTWKF